MAETQVAFADLLETLKRAAALLREAGVPFVLGGGMAVWARKPEDAETALDALAAGGFRAERPPEQWLYKAWDGNVLVDLIFEPSGVTIDDQFIECAPEIEVYAVQMACSGPRTCSSRSSSR